MSEARNPFELMFSDALRDALTAVLERAAEQVKPEECGPLGLSIPEAAAYMGVTETAMRELCHRDGFPVIKVGGKFLVIRSGLPGWMERESGHVS